MAIFCLSDNLNDLKSRLAKIVIGYTRENKPIFASEVEGIGAMATLLRDALTKSCSNMKTILLLFMEVLLQILLMAEFVSQPKLLLKWQILS